MLPTRVTMQRMATTATVMPTQRSLSVLEAKVRSQKLDWGGGGGLAWDWERGWWVAYQEEVVRQDGNRQDVKELPSQ